MICRSRASRCSAGALPPSSSRPDGAGRIGVPFPVQRGWVGCSASRRPCRPHPGPLPVGEGKHAAPHACSAQEGAQHALLLDATCAGEGGSRRALLTSNHLLEVRLRGPELMYAVGVGLPGA